MLGCRSCQVADSSIIKWCQTFGFLHLGVIYTLFVIFSSVTHLQTYGSVCSVRYVPVIKCPICWLHTKPYMFEALCWKYTTG